MKQIRIFGMIVIAVLLIGGLAACTRSLSGVPDASTETEPVSEGSDALPTDDIMAQLGAFATQTAMVQQGGAPIQQTPAPSGDATAQATAGEATAVPTTVVEATPVPTTASFPVPTATPGKPTSYTLQGGEHPYCIARRFDVNPVTMLTQSGLSGNSFSAGTVLRIPQSGGGFPGARALQSHPDTYTVRQGDSIYSIACDYGDVDPNDIIAANGLQAPYRLTVGQSLHIP
jgi:LysM repeat protein